MVRSLAVVPRDIGGQKERHQVVQDLLVVIVRLPVMGEDITFACDCRPGQRTGLGDSHPEFLEVYLTDPFMLLPVSTVAWADWLIIHTPIFVYRTPEFKPEIRAWVAPVSPWQSLARRLRIPLAESYVPCRYP